MGNLFRPRVMVATDFPCQLWCMTTETIYDILHREHESVQALLDKLDETTAPAARTRLLERLKTALVPHMHAEELVLYARLREGEDSREPALDAKEEHRAATHTLHELERLDPANEKWRARFHVLKESIEHHVREEEGKVFKAAKSVIDGDEAVELGREFLAAKQQFLGSQHLAPTG